MRFEVAPLPLDVVVCFFLWTGIVPSLWEFVWNVSRNGICLYYYLVYPSLGRLYFTHNSGWHLLVWPRSLQIYGSFLLAQQISSISNWEILKQLTSVALSQGITSTTLSRMRDVLQEL